MGKFSSYTTTYPTTVYPEPTLPLDIDLLTGICSQQGRSGDEARETIPYLTQLIESMGLEPLFDKNNNLYVVKGVADVYPCMVAHMDTVHSYVDNYGVAVSTDGTILYAYGSGSSNENLPLLSAAVEQAGVGGDDRCGIYVALHLLRELPAMKVAFFVEEEIGGRKGSGAAYMDFFSDVSLVLQCDRKGNNDWVQRASGTQLSSDDFIDSIRPLLSRHKYLACQSGGFTDVVNLRGNKLEVCSANMSCGYYDPHSSTETIHLPSLENTLNLCYEVISLLGHEKQVFPYTAAKSWGTGTTTNTAKTTYWSPLTVGFVTITLPAGQGVKYKGYNNAEYTTYNVYQLLDKEGNVLIGPLPWSECEAPYKKLLAKQKEDKERKARKEARELRDIIKKWVAEDPIGQTWHHDRHNAKQGGVWVKTLIDEAGDGYEVAYAAKLTEIPYSEGEFQREFGKDLLEGTITVSQVFDLIAEMEVERQALQDIEDAQEEERLASQGQLKLTMGGRSEAERAYDNAYKSLSTADDDDDYGSYATYAKLKVAEQETEYDYTYKKLTCPNCKTTSDRVLGRWGCAGDEFFCDDCGMYSDENDTDGTFKKPTYTTATPITD